MGKLLVITHSWDATSDLIVKRVGPANVFRLNYDLSRELKLEINSEHVRIEHSGDVVESTDVAKVVWWKAFNTSTDLDSYAEAELRYIFREIYNLFERSGKCILSRPHAHHLFGKITQMIVAEKYFRVPEWAVELNRLATPFHQPTIVKSLSSSPMADGRVLYAQEVDPSHLDGQFPWLLQRTIPAIRDINSSVRLR